jgi:hypothetical protein
MIKEVRPCYYWITPYRRCISSAVLFNQENQMAFCKEHGVPILRHLEEKVLTKLGWP